MKAITFAVAALLATGATLAIAQAASTAAAPSNASTLQQQMISSLQKSGFTNIKVMPDSFLVQANDKAGHPVMMFITPNSMTEITNMGATSGAHASNVNTSGNAGASSPQNATMFMTIPAQDGLGSRLIGLNIYNSHDKPLGSIKDVAFNANGRVNGYILSVGGFLGVGDHYVAVRPAAVDLSWNAKSQQWHATMNATADQLKAAPEYKYAS